MVMMGECFTACEGAQVYKVYRMLRLREPLRGLSEAPPPVSLSNESSGTGNEVPSFRHDAEPFRLIPR